MNSAGSSVRRRTATGGVAAVLAMVAALVASTLGVGGASAVPRAPYPNHVTTLVCDSANPWPAGTLRIRVDVLNDIAFPADGLPGPAIALIGTDRAKPVALEYTWEVSVAWRNLRTGAGGLTTIPGRGPTIKWQVDLHPGSGPVSFTIRQKIGALAFNPMVNPQYSSCRGRARA